MPKRTRTPRPHPYAEERSPEWEERIHGGRVTALWAGVTALMVAVGFYLSSTYGPAGSAEIRTWDDWTLVPLFSGLALLGIGLFRKPWTDPYTFVGWILFGFYWAMTARDLFVTEDSDYVNSTGAVLLTFLSTYLAYHVWLNRIRGVRNEATNFTSIVAFIAAGSYFLIAKVQVIRVWLIETVGHHTNYVLNLFGLGSEKGLNFIIDRVDSQGPVTFHYPDTYCDPFRPDAVGEFCKENGYSYNVVTPTPDGSLLDRILFYTPDGDLTIVPVTIILACTAIQTIMFFVALFVGTKGKWQDKALMSFLVGGIIYLLNLLRNTMVIAAYGRGVMSFWFVHNFLAKVASFSAIILLAVFSFRRMPQLLQSLIGVIDLIDRDGPIERTLRIGRRRPEPAQAPQEG